MQWFDDLLTEEAPDEKPSVTLAGTVENHDAEKQPDLCFAWGRHRVAHLDVPGSFAVLFGTEFKALFARAVHPHIQAPEWPAAS